MGRACTWSLEDSLSLSFAADLLCVALNKSYKFLCDSVSSSVNQE